MDELKIVKLAELRSKMGAIPAKLLVTFLLSGALYWSFSFEKFKEDPVQNIFVFIITYGIISYFWLCVKMTGNWIIGIVVALVLIFAACSTEKMNGIIGTLLGCAVCFGGPVIDILTIIRYFMIKKKVFGIPGDAWEGEPEEDWEQWQANSGQQEQQTRHSQESSVVFFADCKDQAGVRRRYRDLCKVYHPDSGNGSPEVFNRIREEYERLLEQYGQPE